MLELPMRAALSDLSPAVSLNHSNHLPNFHSIDRRSSSGGTRISPDHDWESDCLRATRGFAACRSLSLPLELLLNLPRAIEIHGGAAATRVSGQMAILR
jgi:hypothetical protein